MCQLMQMSLIRRGFEKSGIQEQLIRHEQKLDGARWRFQVRCAVFFFSFFFLHERVTDHGRDQLSLSIETRYVLSAFGGAASNNPPRIVDKGIIANPMESPEAPSSLAGYPSKCPVSSFEVMDQFHGHSGSLLPFLAIVTADSEDLQPDLESPSPAIPMPAEGEFLADVIGDTDEFGVRPCLSTFSAAL
jgi:hypothetical protein